MEKYDSSTDTKAHKQRVLELMQDFSQEILKRAEQHDNSKLKQPEKSIFDEFSPKLKHTEYNSSEYKSYLKQMSVALKHHYENNSHHPEHYDNGVSDFNLFDLVEMFFDWKASSERNKNGNVLDSICINKDRFNLSEQLFKILINTAIFISEN